MKPFSKKINCLVAHFLWSHMVPRLKISLILNRKNPGRIKYEKEQRAHLNYQFLEIDYGWKLLRIENFCPAARPGNKNKHPHAIGLCSLQDIFIIVSQKSSLLIKTKQ